MLFGDLDTGLVVRLLVQGVLAGRHGGKRSGIAADPDRLLVFQPASVVFHPGLAQSRNQRNHAVRPNVDQEFSSLKLGLKKILPCIGNFFRRDKIFVVNNHLDGACLRDNVPLVGIDHCSWNGQHFVFSHPEDVNFFYVFGKFIVKVSGQMDRVPVFSHARFELQQKALGCFGAIYRVQGKIEKRVLLLKRCC